MLCAAALANYRLVPLARSQAGSGSLTNWLNSGLYQVSIGQGQVDLMQLDPVALCKNLSSDILRLSKAGRETCAGVQKNIAGDQPSWAAIKIYYAAFYYMSAMLRICGTFPAYIRTTEFLGIRSYVNQSSLNSPIALKTGQFLLSLSPSVTSLEISKPGTRDGVHEYVWSAALNLLDVVLSGLRASTFSQNQQLTIIKQLTYLKSAVRDLNSSDYLSKGRNDIQYRQAMGSWSPQNKDVKKQSYEALCNGIWNENDLSGFQAASGVEFAIFINKCAAICSLGHHLLIEMSTIDGGFSRQNYIKYHQSIMAA